MKNISTKTVTFLMLWLLTFVPFSAFAADESAVDAAVYRTAEYVLKTTVNPQVGSIGGEWAVLGLARSGYDVPNSYYDMYYKNVEDYVRSCKGVLHNKRYTEYSRLIIGLTAAGYDPRNVAGYDLTLPLGDFEKTVWQGINGSIFALIALDSMDYPMPQNSEAAIQATRDLYVDDILRRQLSDGGFNLTAGTNGEIAENEKSACDLTGMALQALAKYQYKPEVKEASDKAIAYLAAMQGSDGGYSSGGIRNSESTAQVLTALCELGISVDDYRFVKNGNTIIDNILTYQNEDGSFKHTLDGSSKNQMATEQALYSLAAAQRAIKGRNSLYIMSDSEKHGDFSASEGFEQKIMGLPGKHKDITQKPICYPEKTFDDIKGHMNQTAIEELAARDIIGGRSEAVFDPDTTMTRAEFSTIITRALGLLHKTTNVFDDVEEGLWYSDYIGTAYSYGIVTGTSDNTFSPEGIITRQEAAVMVARAASLCGIDTQLNDTETRDILAQFGDYIIVSDWARPGMAICYSEGILNDGEFNIQPLNAVKRCEVAEMLYNMLARVNLL